MKLTTKTFGKVLSYLEGKSSVTAFQIAHEAGFSLPIVFSAIQKCVFQGFLRENPEQDCYLVISQEEREELREKENKKIIEILDKLSRDEINYLKDIFEDKTRQRVNMECNCDQRFERYGDHLIEIGLFNVDEEREQYYLALSEKEYLNFYEKLQDYPKIVVEDDDDEEEEEEEDDDDSLEESDEEEEDKDDFDFSLDEDEEEEEDDSPEENEERMQYNKDVLQKISDGLPKDVFFHAIDNFDTFSVLGLSEKEAIIISGTISMNGTVYLNDSGETIGYINKKKKYAGCVDWIEEIIAKYGVEKHWVGSGGRYVLIKKSETETVTHDSQELYNCIMEVRAIVDKE